VVRAPALKPALLSFAAVWAALLLLFSFQVRAETTLGAMIGAGMEALGAAIVLWTPVFGTVHAIRAFRRKTHL
jgi:hypothetical protein